MPDRCHKGLYTVLIPQLSRLIPYAHHLYISEIQPSDVSWYNPRRLNAALLLWSEKFDLLNRTFLLKVI